MLVHLAEMKVIKWFSTAFCTPRPGIGLHRTYEKRKHISMTLTISRGVALLFLKNKQLNRLIQEYVYNKLHMIELFQILKDDAVKVLHSICQQIWETQQWPQDWKRSVFIPIPKKGNAKERSNYHTIALISHASKGILKIL